MADDRIRPRGTDMTADAHARSDAHSAGEHEDHGNTPAAWTAVAIIMIAFVVGAVAVLQANWLLFWVGGVGLVVVGAVVGKVMSMMGMGKQPEA
jgi:1,4-dihydroxy-2-naphthoate octaprenyltransferase